MRRFVVSVVLGVTAALLPAAVSTPADAAGPHTVFVQISRAKVSSGSTVRIFGSVLPQRSRPLKLLMSTGRGWKPVKTTMTSANGRYSFKHRVKGKTRVYRVCKIGGSQRCSRTVKVKVRGAGGGGGGGASGQSQPAISVTSVAAYELTTDQGYSIAGTASADLIGKAVYLQLYSNSEWSSISAAAVVAPDGTWSIGAPASQAGRNLTLRVYAPATRSTLAASAALSPFTVYGWYYLDTFDAVAGYMDDGSAAINGVTYSRSAWAEWDYFEINLSRACKTFSAFVGLDDEASTTSRETATITGDSRQLYRKTGVKLGEMTPVTIDVTGILRLRIDDTHETGSNWQVVYGDARVLCAY